MTEHIRKRAVELSEERLPWDVPTSVELGLSHEQMHRTRDIARAAYKDAMLRTLPIIERLMNPEHDEDCGGQYLVYPTHPPQMTPCNCTLGKAREEARKLVGG